MEYGVEDRFCSSKFQPRLRLLIGLLPLARAGTTGRLARMIYLSEENGQPPYTYEYLPASHCASFIEAT